MLNSPELSLRIKGTTPAGTAIGFGETVKADWALVARGFPTCACNERLVNIRKNVIVTFIRVAVYGDYYHARLVLLQNCHEIERI